METILYPTTTPATSETCHGHGEVPTGYITLYGALSYQPCDDCNGRGYVRNCDRCCDTGIDLEAPVNLANPPQCPCCQTEQEAA